MLSGCAKDQKLSSSIILSFNIIQFVSHDLRKRQDNDSHIQLLHEFIKDSKAFRASTCDRHVYIYTSTNINIEKMVTQLRPFCDSCEHFSGTDAYSFLLQWAVGFVSTKSKEYYHNDRFILGKIREGWDKYLKKNPDRSLIRPINFLLEDVNLIRRNIETKVYGEGDLYISNLKEIFKQIVDLRTANLTVINDSMLNGMSYNNPQERERLILNRKIESVSKQLDSLQKGFNCHALVNENLKPSLKKSTQLRQFKMLERGIILSHEKKNLRSEDTQMLIKKSF